MTMPTGNAVWRTCWAAGASRRPSSGGIFELRGPNERLWRWVCAWGYWVLICLIVRFRKGSACA